MGRRLVYALPSIAICAAIWQATCSLLRSPLLPSPVEVAQTLPALVETPALYVNLGASIQRVGLGYAGSVALALPVALLCFRLRPAAAIALPIHDFIRYIPVPALVPLLAALLGIGDATKITLIFVGTYFQILFLFLADLAVTPSEIEDSARTLGVSGARLMLFVTLPAASARLLDSSRIAFGWAWSYLLVAEVVNAERGIGFLVLQAYRTLDMPRLLSLLVIIGAFGLLTDALFRTAAHIRFPWSRDVS